MAPNRPQNSKPKKRLVAPRYTPKEAPAPYVPKPIVTYGPTVMLLEDSMRNTFEYKKGTWVPFAMSIAECRKECLVKELAQKVNDMTRYEVRFPI